MGLTNRITTLLKQKVNTLLDKYEDPKEALDYSYQNQIETMNKLRRSIAEVVTAKTRLQMQKTKLVDNIRTLDEESRRAIDQDREDLAKLALERKNANMLQLQNLDKQIVDMQTQQDKLEQTEKRLSTKVEEFRSKKEVIKAQYTAAEAQVRIKENLTGISEEMADVGVAMNKAEDKTEQMKAKAQALDEMIDSGVLTDYTSNKDDVEAELEKMTVKSSVDQELAKLKAERDKKQRKITDAEESETEVKEKQQEQEQEQEVQTTG
ncbi:MAG TPA: PspA/IM30 family protein [Candidatus Bathyarchaeia archaeon]|nr:PspA/IM30 family protein [Candidatus Bathyarchaeia archaeon]